MTIDIKNTYLRIGKVLYKKSERPIHDGSYKTNLIPWSLHLFSLEVENWRNEYRKLEKYDDFTFFPAHTHYKRNVNNYYNKYEPLPYEPIKGNCDSILDLIKHVFGDQYVLGLDFLTIMYRYPVQILPILCLVSSLTNTGKTTFLNFLKSIYGDNMALIGNEEFASQFNSNWTKGKILIGMEEVYLTDNKLSEKIKNASTAKVIGSQSKGVDTSEIEFFGKFILVSNHEEDLIYISKNETRFWVRKLEAIENLDPFFGVKLTQEIPAFLYLLANREISCPQKTRMWFTPEQIETEQLIRIKTHFGDPIKYEVMEIVDELMQANDLKELKFNNSDMLKLLRVNGVKIRRMQLKKVLEQDLKLKHIGNSLNYETYTMDQNGIPYKVDKKGKYYCIEASR